MEIRFLFQADTPNSEVAPVAGGEGAVFSSRSPDKETSNEDSAAMIAAGPDAAVLVVADGVGGSPAGEQASAIAIRQLIAAIEQAPRDDGPTLRPAILNGIENANRAIAELGVGAATTLAVAEIQGRTVRPYHVGDCMVLVVGQRGKIKLQTVSHSPVGYAVEAGVIDETEAMHHAERHVVSNMLGMPDMRIEVGSTIELAQYDTLLLATDGLFDNLRIEEIVERIRKGPLKRLVRTLADDCHRRMQLAEEGQPSKSDDLTFVAFRLARPARVPPGT